MYAIQIKLKKNYIVTQDGYLVNFLNGDVFQLNTIGLKIIQMLEKGNTPDEIAIDIANEYHISQERALKDVWNFLKRLEKEGIADVSESER